MVVKALQAGLYSSSGHMWPPGLTFGHLCSISSVQGPCFWRLWESFGTFLEIHLSCRSQCINVTCWDFACLALFPGQWLSVRTSHLNGCLFHVLALLLCVCSVFEEIHLVVKTSYHVAVQTSAGKHLSSTRWTYKSICVCLQGHIFAPLYSNVTSSEKKVRCFVKFLLSRRVYVHKAFIVCIINTQSVVMYLNWLFLLFHFFFSFVLIYFLSRKKTFIAQTLRTKEGIRMSLCH